jgi:DNA-binding transcriptional LysR family regulator
MGHDDVAAGFVLPASHPLAACDQIPCHQLWDEPFVAPAETGVWRDYWLATRERQGHPVRIGVVTDTNPVVQDFVRCCLDNKPPQHLKNQPDRQVPGS